MSAPAQVIVAGHVCLDIIPQLLGPAEVDPGHLLHIGPAAISAGGAVANTGMALHRLGVPVRLVGKVGDDVFGRAVLNVLQAGGVRLADDMIVTPGEATSYSIVLSPPGVDRSFLHCPGANDTFGADDLRYDRFGEARLLHFGYPPLMRRMRAKHGEQLRQLFERARPAGLATSLDMSQPDPNSEAGQIDWEALLTRVLPMTDVFLPSIEELLFMLDRPAYQRYVEGIALAAVVDRRLLRHMADRLTTAGSAVVVIKMGEHGLYLRASSDTNRITTFCERLGLDPATWTSREVLSPCFRVDRVVGTTGSGDCTIAGFLAALLRGDGPVDAATSATAVGACSVEAADATSGVLPWAAVAARVAAVWERWPVSIDLGDSASRCDANGTLVLDGRAL